MRKVRYNLDPGLDKEEEEKFYKKGFEKHMSTRSGDDAGWLRTEEHIEKNEEKKIRRMRYLSPYL